MNGTVAYKLRQAIQESEHSHGWRVLDIRQGRPGDFEVVIISGETGEMCLLRSLDDWATVVTPGGRSK